LFEAYSQAGDNPEPDLDDDIGSAAFICATPLLPPASPQAQADF
jgi:hypothetical protein